MKIKLFNQLKFLYGKVVFKKECLELNDMLVKDETYLSSISIGEKYTLKEELFKKIKQKINRYRSLSNHTKNYN
jgi:hypothetical protein